MLGGGELWHFEKNFPIIFGISSSCCGGCGGRGGCEVFKIFGLVLEFLSCWTSNSFLAEIVGQISPLLLPGVLGVVGVAVGFVESCSGVVWGGFLAVDFGLGFCVAVFGAWG